MRWNPALHELRRLAVTEQAIGALKSARLSMHYTMWPREWQIQPWCAARAEGGPLREVGTHCEHLSMIIMCNHSALQDRRSSHSSRLVHARTGFFGIMECFGHECVTRVQANVTYPDGAEGSAAESAACGQIELASGLCIALDVRTDSQVGDVYVRKHEQITRQLMPQIIIIPPARAVYGVTSLYWIALAEASCRCLPTLGVCLWLSLQLSSPCVCFLVRLMHARTCMLQELEVVGETGGLMLTNFSQLKRTAPTEEWIVKVSADTP